MGSLGVVLSLSSLFILFSSPLSLGFLSLLSHSDPRWRRHALPDHAPPPPRRYRDGQRRLGPEVVAFRVCLVAAPVQQEPVLGFNFSVWLQRWVSLIEADSSGSSSGSDQEMSSVEEEIEERTSLCNQLLPSDRRFRH
ncbi:hypothetical protein PVAP13_2KG338200 [Panicum virgatum]|uniref:Uncharacterized protein n=1 Tax=Panicum virgatum TaxID=38727 RepID=A0A8T0WK20_PANVG|nr:hypothetical protein PVAP13_2KG338200 [Panicum virgatum]